VPTPPRTYPVTCPSCEQVKGYPTSVATVPGDPCTLVMKLCCHACDHRWQDTIETEPAFRTRAGREHDEQPI